MKKINYIIIVILGLLFTASSCTKKGDEIVRILDIDKSSLVLNKEAHVETIKVTVDAGVSYSAIWKGETWGRAEANVQEGVVTITIQSNDTPTLRKASVVITTADGLRNRVVEITQNGDNPQLDVIPDEITFDFMGGEFTAKIESNIKWGATSGVDWVELDLHIQAGDLIVKVAENKDIQARSTTLVVTAGIAEKEVVVKQDAPELFFFPYLNMNGATFEMLEKFENDRHNSVTKGEGRQTSHVAYTKSHLMPIISYDNLEMTKNGLSNSVIKIHDQYMPGFFDEGSTKGKVHELVLEHGFEFIAKSNNKVYYWLDYGAEAEYHCMLSVISTTKALVFEGKKAKPVLDAPTFDVFPYPPTDLIPWGSDETIINNWETLNGGTMLVNDEDVQIYIIPESSLYKMRYYNYAGIRTDLEAIDYLFLDLSKIFIQMPDYAYLLNPKLEALLEKEGFKYIGNTGPSYVYENTAKELRVLIGAAYAHGDESEDPVKYGALTFSPIPVESGVAPKNIGKSLSNIHMRLIK